MRALLLFALVASTCMGEVLRVEPFGQDGVMVKVDVFEAIAKVKEMRNLAQDEYVETLNRPKAGQLYADSIEGVSDQKTVAYTEKKRVGIFQAVGDSIAENPWNWAVGTAAAGFVVYKVGDNYGWWDRGDSGSSYTAPPIQTGDNSPVIIIINNDHSETDYDAPVTTESGAGE